MPKYYYIVFTDRDMIYVDTKEQAKKERIKWQEAGCTKVMIKKVFYSTKNGGLIVA